jgi:hypothetical protein
MDLANRLLCRFGFSSTLDKYQAAANVVFRDNLQFDNTGNGAALPVCPAPAVVEKPAKRGKTAEKAPDYQYASVVSSNTLSELGLPRIIVIGDEKAGKSSTLERIACVDIFPTEKKFCTRQPILLKMRNNSAIPQPNTLFKVTIPSNNGSDDVKTVASVDAVRCILKDRMDFLKSSGQGIIADQAIIVEIENARVPTMDLVDLPGLFEAQLDPSSNDPKNLSEMVEACTRRYLDDPQTGVVVCVIPANTENLRTSKAIRLMQTAARPSLQKSAIGVFAKSDLSYYQGWASEKENDGPLHKLESWLRKRDNENFDFLGSGCVAVMNRNTQAANPLDLQTQEIEEMDYFKRNLSLKSGFVVSQGKKDAKELSGKGIECFGLEALTRKIDQVFCKHIACEWVPKELQKMQRQKSKVQEDLQSLGSDPAKLRIEDFLSATDEWLNSAFFGSNKSMNVLHAVHLFLEQFCKDAMQKAQSFCGHAECDVDPFIMKVIKKRNVLQHVNNFVSGGTIVKSLRDICKMLLQSSFEQASHAEPVRLNRFDSVLALVLAGIEDEINKNAPIFQRETIARLERVYSDSFFLFEGELAGHLLDSVTQWLFIPLFAVDEIGGVKADNTSTASKKRGRAEASSTPVSAFTFTKHLYQQLTSAPAERDSSKRAALVASINACEAIEKELRSFGEKHGAEIANRTLNDAFVQLDD